MGHNLDISSLFVSSDSGLENWRLDETEQIFSRCCDSTTGRILDYKIEICNNFHGSVAAESISLELELNRNVEKVKLFWMRRWILFVRPLVLYTKY